MMVAIAWISVKSTQNEPRHEKICLRDFQPGPTQTGPKARDLKSIKFVLSKAAVTPNRTIQKS